MICAELEKLNILDGIRAATSRIPLNNKDIVPRTQISLRLYAMEQKLLICCMIAPGRVFRSDEVDATHPVLPN